MYQNFDFDFWNISNCGTGFGLCHNEEYIVKNKISQGYAIPFNLEKYGMGSSQIYTQNIVCVYI